ARVDVQARGRTYSQERSYAEIARLSDQELEEKFKHNTSGILPEQKIEEAVKSIWELEELENISQLMTAVAG
ncbi:MAG: hypothetical protein ACE5IA_06760, partial [Dehalococcoidia bacterium]